MQASLLQRLLHLSAPCSLLAERQHTLATTCFDTLLQGPTAALEGMPPTLLVQLIQHVHALKGAMEARATAAEARAKAAKTRANAAKTKAKAAEAQLAALRAVERYIVDPLP